MMDFVKYLYWDMVSHWQRDHYVATLLRNIPGELGVALRRKWYSRKFRKAGRNLSIYQGVVIINPQNVECGESTHIGLFDYVQAGGGVTLGNNVLLGPFAKIWTQNHNYADPDAPVYTQGYTFKPVIIGHDVWVGANAFIMPGVVLGDRCVVSANSVVGRKEYPEGTILAGYPARKIGTR